MLAAEIQLRNVPRNRGAINQRLVGAVAVDEGVAINGAAAPVAVRNGADFVDWSAIKRRSGRLCVWGANILSVQDCRFTLMAAVGANGVEYINAVSRVLQPGGVVRYDIYVEKGNEELVKQRIANHPRCHNWYVRNHVANPQERRHHRRPQNRRRVARRIPMSVFRTVTWNIRSINGKRSDVEVLCNRVGVDVVAIQETLRKGDAWPIKLTGYNCVEQSASDEAGVHGLMLAVRKGLQVYSVGNPTGNFMFLRVFSPQLAYPIICGCVYVPIQGIRSRRVVIRNLRTEIAKLKNTYPNAKVIVMGDFNGDQNKVQDWLLEGRDGIQNLSFVPIRGPSATWFGPRGRSSSIIRRRFLQNWYEMVQSVRSK